MLAKWSLCTLLLLLALLPAPAVSMSIIPQPWQPLVNRADLVGVVECITAGEIVARYRVVESWKGPAKGSELTIRGAASVYGPSLPIVLVGDRLLVAAWKYRPEYRLATSLFLAQGPGGSLPPFWRDERPDYFIPSALDFTTLSPPGPPSGVSRLLGGYDGDLDAFRRDALALLGLHDEAREAAVLRALIGWHLMGEYPWTSQSQSFDSGLLNDLWRRSQTTHVDSIINALDTFVKAGGGDASIAVDRVLYMGGGSYSLALLLKIRNDDMRWVGTTLPSAIRGIRLRLGLDPPEEYNPIAVPPKPSAEAIDTMRTLVRTEPTKESGRDPNGFRRYSDRRKAFEILSVYDPDFIERFLLDWNRPSGGVGHENDGYGMGSFFAWRCGEHRGRHLKSLLKARDPYIRVAGAIYLVFEREAEGVRALRQLSTLPDDAGAWAALNLARRGEKRAMTRALEVLRSLSGPTVDSQFRRNLQKRLYVLLSNSAAQSGVRQPEPWSYSDSPVEQVYKNLRLLSWWKTNESRLVLYDPWYEGLKAEKIE